WRRPCRARHGFEREPGAWAARTEPLQRARRVRLLPSAVPVQRRGRLPRGETASRQRRQRRRLGRAAPARTRAPAGGRQARRLPGGRRLRETRDLRGVGGAGVDYVIRIPANRKLELAIEDILFRPRGRPSRKPLVRYKSFSYQADSWTTPR